MARLTVKIAGKTDKGLKRSKNEDAFLIDPELGLMIVADGMGGHNAGEVASRLAIQLMGEQLKRALSTGHVPVFTHVHPKIADVDQRTLLLGDCIKFSNAAIFEAGQKTEQNHNMGTTIVAALWLGDRLSVAHVGDSRLYMVRNNDLTLCTTDHSFVQEQIDKGLISNEDAEKSDFRNMLTRSVGISEDVNVDIQELLLIPDDYILLCSDGITKMISEETILLSFKDLKDPDLIAADLIKKANDAGGKDNITAVVARVDGAPGTWNNLTGRFKNLFAKEKKEGGELN